MRYPEYLLSSYPRTKKKMTQLILYEAKIARRGGPFLHSDLGTCFQMVYVL